MNNRRKFIISSLSGLAIAVLPKLTYASSNPDVVVIGAGAAGLAATSELIKNGKKVICLEASNRIGGRAYTDNEIFGEPYDLGALWLENGDTNPFKIYGEKNSGIEIKPGMTFTIEPMINAGKFDVKMLNDGWTAVTKDKSLSAQFEHTIGITENGYEIFTESAKGYTKPPYN